MKMDYSVFGDDFHLTEPSNFKVEKAKMVINAVGYHEDFELVDCLSRQKGDVLEEIIIACAEAGIIQRPVVDIKFREKLAFKFSSTDKWHPEVYSLKKDFPDAMHMNLQPIGQPKSICIYTESFQEKQLSWTAMDFLNRISAWLVRTSKGELHQEDQPLEPFLLSDKNDLVIPTNFFDMLSNDKYILTGYPVIRNSYQISFLMSFIESRQFDVDKKTG